MPSNIPRPLVVVLYLATLLQSARADCWVDDFGNERCNLSTGVRVGVAIGIVIIVLALLFALTTYRRRRMQAAHLAFIPTNNNNANQYNPNQFGNAGYAPQYAPQYPPQPFGGGYDPQSGFAPPHSPPPAHHMNEPPPPQYYPPPPGAPPYSGAGQDK
ncbi:hypothetical protein BV25DRAFT_1912041 [Artomyces pyxidatus]|uniref:Uncharacterized protein n=1 Tax=Artomyces pyxidatus TaxID=48021 RepID=A0ACB8TG57_9AGAM|nr:hypothetical protein BV25DRAFT_1912041 [Artomyces pyxidatus]